jgi:hypothetical protein
MMEGVMNRSHWNRSRKSNMGFLLPTQGCRQLTNSRSRLRAFAVGSIALPRRALLAEPHSNTALRRPRGQSNSSNARG